MQRFAMTVMLKDDPEIIEQYENYHANPFPEVNEGLKKCGVLKMYIYRFGRQLFMYMETDDNFDLEHGFDDYTENPRAKEWDDLMRSFQETVPGAPEGSTWVPMKELYSLE